MLGRRTVGRAIFFGLGYVAGTRAGHERYVQIVAVAKKVASTIRSDDDAERGAAEASTSLRSSTRSSPRDPDPYADITLGTP